MHHDVRDTKITQSSLAVITPFEHLKRSAGPLPAHGFYNNAFEPVVSRVIR